jgi:tetratricopeptide (TPR) repeat protein
MGQESDTPPHPADGPDRTVFISYRVEDTRPTASRLFEELAAAYGAKHVFLDHERLKGGAEWPARLEAEARRATVMLVLVGKGWLPARDPKTFARRLDQPGDWVRKEIEIALGTGALVVPVLVEGAEPLSKQAFETVPSLAPLADRQELLLGSRGWASNLARLHELLATRGFVRRQPDRGPDAAGDGATVVVAVHPFTVPDPVADFTGREAEIAKLEKALASGTGRVAICAVNGLGGVGKSQLAYELARRTAQRFPDGQVHLDLRGTTPDPLALEAALAELIGAVQPQAKPPADLARLQALYGQVWRGRRALLLLDDAKDEAQVRDLAPPPPVALLVTSRRQFVPEGGRMVRLDVLPEAQAVGLLREVLGTERLMLEQEARELARECGRLPLALRAAAGFLLLRPAWDVAEYLAELRERGIAALDKVETVVGHSLDRLAEEDGELARRFALLGAFSAGFDAAAAAAVWGIEARAAREGLDALADWSLVQVERVDRYRLHDLVRGLALTRAEPWALEEARARHAGHYAWVLARADRLYLSGAAGVVEGLALFDAEWVNIEAGQRWAVASADSREDAAALVARYPGAGAHVLHLRFDQRQWIAWLKAALAACRRLGDRLGEGTTLGNLGVAWRNLGEAGKAIVFFEQHLAIAREIRDRRGEGRTLGNLGVAWMNLGEIRKAIIFFEQHLTIAREVGHRRGEGKALGNLGAAWADLGETRKAIVFFEQHLAIAREVGHRRGEAHALCNLGLAWARLGEAAKAIAFYEQHLEVVRELGDQRGVGQALSDLGLTWADLGEIRKAIVFFEQHREIAHEVGDRLGEAGALYNGALTHEQLGEHDRAIAAAKAALVILRAIESPHASAVEAWLRERGVEP